MGRAAAGEEDQRVELECSDRFGPDFEVPIVNRIEGSSKKSNSKWCGHQW